MIRLSFPFRATALLAMGVMAGMASSAAQARTDVTPYIELDQTFIANLKGGGDDVLTYTTAAIGVDGSVLTPRAEAVLSLRYEHQFGWNKRTPDSDIISGIARARYSAIQDSLSIEGGALATRARTDGYSTGTNGLVTAGDSTTQVYSLYAGPTFTTDVGAATVNAAYRIGYTRVEDDVNVTIGGVPALGVFDESVYHNATASVGMQPGPLPFGWSLGAAYDREDATELDQRYEAKQVRGDVTVPVTSTLALVGGVGYEDIEISQRAALLDGTGNPVISNRGGLVSDTSVPRLISYDADGLIWDAGVLWRPSRRTSLEARVGRRYQSTHYVGNFTWRASANSLVEISYFDRIDSFGRVMNGALIGLPTSGFNVLRNPFTGDINGCVGSDDGGSCFNDALAAISGTNYRNRGITGQYAWTGRRWNWGAGLGYSRRKFIAPDSSIFASLDGTTDEYYFGEVYGGYKLDPNSTLGASIYGNHFDAGTGGIDITNYGSYVSYNRLFGRRLSARASLGLDALDTSDLDTIISLLGQVGVRYQF